MDKRLVIGGRRHSVQNQKLPMESPMDDFEAWQKIMEEWKLVRRAKKLNQQLYDMLGGAILYILHYAEKDKIDLPNKNELRRMSENIHDLVNRVNEVSD